MNTIDISTYRVKGAFTEALKTTRLGDTIVYHIGEYAAGLHRDPAMKAQEGGYVALVYKKPTGATYLCFPAAGVKGAMATAALETEGIKKTSVQRLIFLPESQIQIWGKPYLKMDIVRSADMNKTPDVRSRAYLPNWCAEVDIKFVTPTLSAFCPYCRMLARLSVSETSDKRKAVVPMAPSL